MGVLGICAGPPTEDAWSISAENTSGDRHDTYSRVVVPLLTTHGSKLLLGPQLTPASNRPSFSLDLHIVCHREIQWVWSVMVVIMDLVPNTSVPFCNHRETRITWLCVSRFAIFPTVVA